MSIAEPPLTVVSIAETPDTQRERAKADRRQRIIDATCALLRAHGLDDVSGKQIAARAGVSLSTVYNLFGSKDAVLIAIYDEDLARFQAIVAALPSDDALARLFDTIDAAVTLYAQDPAFYRAIMVRRPPGEPLEAALRHPRARFWESLVRRVIDEGHFDADADAPVVSTLLIYLFSGALMDWVAGDISLSRFRAEVTLGFSAVLSPFATDAARARLHAQVLCLQAEVRQLRSVCVGIAAKKA